MTCPLIKQDFSVAILGHGCINIIEKLSNTPKFLNCIPGLGVEKAHLESTYTDHHKIT